MNMFGEGTGFVKISINEKEVLYFKSFGKQVSETLNIGFYPSIYMTKRHRQYLKEHNKRRQEWHELNNVSYVPLAWSPALAEESRVYAVKLLDACNTKGILHEPGGKHLFHYLINTVQRNVIKATYFSQ